MIIHRNRILSPIILSVILSACFHIFIQESALAQDAQKIADLKELERAHEEAYSLLSDEKIRPFLKKKRIAAFSRAASVTRDFQRKWIRDKNSLEYLLSIARLAIYSEFSGHKEDACILHKNCLEHTRISDNKAIYAGERIESISDLKMEEMKCSRHYTPSSSGSGVTRTDEVVVTEISVGKGDIDIRRELIRNLEPRKPLSIDEAVSLVLRKTTPDQINDAITIARSVIAEINVPYEYAAGDGVVVFGFGWNVTTAEVWNFYRNLHDAILSVKDQFDLDLTNMNTLTVYVNMEDIAHGFGEEIGRELCKVIHFREMKNLEGYYQPLDNSIVIRKGVRYWDSWFMGTVYHELVHALLHADFPEAPLWLNEGIASLYEAHDLRTPTDNYRLYYLREALLINRLPSLDILLKKWGNAELDLSDSRDDYPLLMAMSRYFAFYLHSVGILPELYRYMRTNFENLENQSVSALRYFTGWNLGKIEEQFVDFIMQRDKRSVDEIWGSLEENINAYVQDLFFQ